jgi:hypothetical protein
VGSTEVRESAADRLENSVVVNSRDLTDDDHATLASHGEEVRSTPEAQPAEETQLIEEVEPEGLDDGMGKRQPCRSPYARGKNPR